ncbi:MAG: tetratricopeptide repeat protein [Crocinitomicaceae bacterium]
MKSLWIAIFSFWFVANAFSQYEKKDLEGIYFGKMRTGQSSFGQNIIIRFYANGDVIADPIPEKPQYMDTFEKVFVPGSKNVETSKYSLLGDRVQFEFYVLQKGIKAKFLFKGTLSFSDFSKAVVFEVHNLATRQKFNLYAKKIWPENNAPSITDVAKALDLKKKNTSQDTINNPAKKKSVDNIENFSKDLEKSIEKKDVSAAVKNMNQIGAENFNQGNFEEAIDLFKEALVLCDLDNNRGAKATIYNNIGVSYDRMNIRKAAIENIMQAKEIFDELDDKVSSARMLNQVAVIEKNHLNLESETKVLTELMEMEEKRGDQSELYKTMNNLSINQAKTKDYENGLFTIEKIEKAALELNDQKLLAKAYNNKGNIRFEQNQKERAKSNYKKSLAIKEKLGDKRSQGVTLHNLGNVYYSSDELDSAQVCYEKSLEYAIASDDHKTANANYKALANLSAKKNNCTESLDYHKLYTRLEHSLEVTDQLKQLYEESEKYLSDQFKLNESLSEDIEKLTQESNQRLMSINLLQENIRSERIKSKQERLLQENKMELLSQEKVILEKENEVIASESETKNYMLFGAGLSGILVLSMLFLQIRHKNRAKKDKNKINEQKEIIEEKNQEFVDSITYASRLQTAILPPQKLVDQQIKENFILYKPKDIVAGDFYWTAVVGNYTYVAAADCTGHGVPGAMVSVVCSNSLDRAVNEFGLRDTGEILNKVRELVVQTFEKSEEEVKDGMDIALIRMEKNKEEIQYTGANNSLVLIRHRGGGESLSERSIYSSTKYVDEIKADKMPVGQYSKMDPFSTNSVKVKKGEIAYLFSDGFPDQFGGSKGKKLKMKALKELFLKISSIQMKEQRTLLDTAFNKWKGEYEQVDDVCVVGVKF